MRGRYLSGYGYEDFDGGGFGTGDTIWVLDGAL